VHAFDGIDDGLTRYEGGMHQMRHSVASGRNRLAARSISPRRTVHYKYEEPAPYYDRYEEPRYAEP